jgi:hypothetical protein
LGLNIANTNDSLTRKILSEKGQTEVGKSAVVLGCELKLQKFCISDSSCLPSICSSPFMLQIPLQLTRIMMTVSTSETMVHSKHPKGVVFSSYQIRRCKRQIVI